MAPSSELANPRGNKMRAVVLITLAAVLGENDERWELFEGGHPKHTCTTFATLARG